MPTGPRSCEETEGVAVLCVLLLHPTYTGHLPRVRHSETWGVRAAAALPAGAEACPYCHNQCRQRGVLRPYVPPNFTRALPHHWLQADEPSCTNDLPRVLGATCLR